MRANPAATENDRKLANVAMVGTIAELDEAAARVRVNADGLVTDWLPWSAGRAGPGVREWSAPEVGEQVVLLCPYGDPSQGVVLGSVYQDAHAAPANLKTTHRTEYADGAFVEYDREAHAMKVDVPSGGKIELCIGGTVLLLEDGKATLTTDEFIVNAPQSTFNGDVTVNGNVDVSGGNVTVTGGDVTADGKSLKTHTHPGVESGSSVTGPPV